MKDRGKIFGAHYKTVAKYKYLTKGKDNKSSLSFNKWLSSDMKKPCIVSSNHIRVYVFKNLSGS